MLFVSLSILSNPLQSNPIQSNPIQLLIPFMTIIKSNHQSNHSIPFMIIIQSIVFLSRASISFVVVELYVGDWTVYRHLYLAPAKHTQTREREQARLMSHDCLWPSIQPPIQPPIKSNNITSDEARDSATERELDRSRTSPRSEATPSSLHRQCLES